MGVPSNFIMYQLKHNHINILLHKWHHQKSALASET
jgi:hypothetical protein